jgi:chitinase
LLRWRFARSGPLVLMLRGQITSVALSTLCLCCFSQPSSQVVAYYGQNSYGATNPGDTGNILFCLILFSAHPRPANYQRNLSYYCSDGTIDVLPIAFLDAFFSGPGDTPSLDLANACSTTTQPALAGTGLPDCAFLARDIASCQAAGTLVTLSLGGASGGAGFADDAQATKFADTIWGMFLGGAGSVRPFGDAVLDGCVRAPCAGSVRGS